MVGAQRGRLTAVVVALLVVAVSAVGAGDARARVGSDVVRLVVRGPVPRGLVPAGARVVDGGPLASLASLGRTVVEAVDGRAVASALREAGFQVEVPADREAVTEPVVPDDPRFEDQYALERVGAPLAWARSTGDPEVVIAVIDSGVMRDHPDLRGRLLPGRDFVDDDDDPEDGRGHGTEVAGVVGAATDNATGVAGMCWDCRLLPVKVIDDEGEIDAAQAAAGMVWAADQGADVINLSFGGGAYSPVEADAIAYAQARGWSPVPGTTST